MIKVNGYEVDFEKFPNGETHVISKSIAVSEDDINRISFKYENDVDLIRLMFVKKHMDKINRFSELIIQYMPYSRMDRSEGGSVFTLKYVAQFINDLNFQKVYVIEPHSSVTSQLLKHSIPVFVNFELLPQVELDVEFDKEHDCLFFPDEGAQERYESIAEDYNMLVGFKERDFKTGKITKLDIAGKLPAKTKKAIIVDDLSSYGGTFVLSAKKLRELGFEEVYLLVAHAENSIFKGELFLNINKIFTTDSILTEQNNWSNYQYKPKLKIYDVETLIWP